MNENEKWGRKRKRKRKTIDDERLRSGCEVKKNVERGKNAEKEQKEIIRKKKRK